MLKKKSPVVSRKPSGIHDSGLPTKRSGAVSEDPYVSEELGLEAEDGPVHEEEETAARNSAELR